MRSMVDVSHDFLIRCLHDQAVCIDATLGQGKDARFFLNQGVRKVYAYEIQKDIYKETIQAIHDPRLTAYNRGHETMENIREAIDAIVFNFGYCPNRNKQITTLPDTSLQAVQIGIEKLKLKGRMALVFYPHEKGKEEAEVITDFLRTQKNIECISVKRLFVDAPYMVGIQKKR